MARELTSLVVSLVLENGVSPAGKTRYKSMSIGKLSPMDYFPDFPDLENAAELAKIYAACTALASCCSLGLANVKEVVESRISA